MPNGVPINVVGNVAREPKLGYSGEGRAYVRFSVAVNRVSGQGERRRESTNYFDVTAFHEQAENVAESLKLGMRVTVDGFMEPPREFDKQDGTKGFANAIVADEIGVSLRWGTISGFTPNARSGNGAAGGASSNGNSARAAAPAPAPAASADGGGDRYDLEEPF